MLYSMSYHWPDLGKNHQWRHVRNGDWNIAIVWERGVTTWFVEWHLIWNHDFDFWWIITRSSKVNQLVICFWVGAQTLQIWNDHNVQLFNCMWINRGSESPSTWIELIMVQRFHIDCLWLNDDRREKREVWAMESRTEAGPNLAVIYEYRSLWPINFRYVCGICTCNIVINIAILTLMRSNRPNPDKTKKTLSLKSTRSEMIMTFRIS